MKKYKYFLSNESYIESDQTVQEANRWSQARLLIDQSSSRIHTANYKKHANTCQTGQQGSNNKGCPEGDKESIKLFFYSLFRRSFDMTTFTPGCPRSSCLEFLVISPLLPTINKETDQTTPPKSVKTRTSKHAAPISTEKVDAINRTALYVVRKEWIGDAV